MKTEEQKNDYFGSCPVCKKTDGFISVGRSHWFFCQEHKRKWFVGLNLFSAWRDQTDDEQREIWNSLEFGDFKEVKHA